MKVLATITLRGSHRLLRMGSIRSPAALPRTAIRGRAFLSEQADDTRFPYYKVGLARPRFLLFRLNFIPRVTRHLRLPQKDVGLRAENAVGSADIAAALTRPTGFDCRKKMSGYARKMRSPEAPISRPR
jgi:hypothetical protein